MALYYCPSLMVFIHETSYAFSFKLRKICGSEIHFSVPAFLYIPGPQGNYCSFINDGHIRGTISLFSCLCIMLTCSQVQILEHEKSNF